MATQTTNYNLVKPALTDSPPDITAMNPNWDKIDLELKNNSSAIGQNTHDIAQLSNPNLLINEAFKINQRGKTTYTSIIGDIAPYTIDRWQIINTGQVGVISDGINLTMTALFFQFRQFMEFNMELLYGKKLTLSCKVGDIIYKGTGFLDKTLNNTPIDVDLGNDISLQLRHDPSLPNTPLVARIMNKVAGRSLNGLKWIKLELGEVATPLSPRPIAEEVVMCKRYCASGSMFGLPYSIDVNYIWFFIPLARLRTTPTLFLGNVAVAVTGAIQTGFIFGNVSWAEGGVYLSAYKPGHGLTENVVLYATSALFDAELY